MRNKINIAMLSMVAIMASAPAFAQEDDDIVTIPEPSVLALFGIGAAAVLVGLRGKKGKKDKK